MLELIIELQLVLLLKVIVVLVGSHFNNSTGVNKLVFSYFKYISDILYLGYAFIYIFGYIFILISDLGLSLLDILFRLLIGLCNEVWLLLFLNVLNFYKFYLNYLRLLVFILTACDFYTLFDAIRQ
jgi:hypothetical protein